VASNTAGSCHRASLPPIGHMAAHSAPSGTACRAMQGRPQTGRCQTKCC
jgi:hypothetical protein